MIIFAVIVLVALYFTAMILMAAVAGEDGALLAGIIGLLPLLMGLAVLGEAASA